MISQINEIVEQIKHLNQREKEINENAELIDIFEKRLLLRKIKINIKEFEQ